MFVLIYVAEAKACCVKVTVKTKIMLFIPDTLFVQKKQILSILEKKKKRHTHTHTHTHTCSLVMTDHK